MLSRDKVEDLVATSLLVILWTLLPSGFGALQSWAQESSTKRCEVAGLTYYEKLLDMVFPRPCSVGWDEYQIVVRIKPSFAPESQMVIRKHLKEGFDVTAFRLGEALRVQDSNVYYGSLDFRERTGRKDPEEFAREVPVETKSVQVPATVMQGLMNDLRAISFSLIDVTRANPDGSVTITVDGTIYEMWIEGHDHALHFKLHGSCGAESDSHPLICWMEKVRQIAEDTPGTWRTYRAGEP